MGIHERVRAHRYTSDISGMEVAALRMLKPIPVETIKPKMVICTPETLPYFHYWRLAISSAGQGTTVSPGRGFQIMMIDETTGGLLGVVAVGDMPMNYPHLQKTLGWDYHGKANEGTDGRERYSKYINTVLMMTRCLPLYEFGDLLGGKLLTLGVMSKELVRMAELKYSFKYAIFVARTLHGAASQYNRLRGLDLMGVDDTGRGLYLGELRKYGLRVLRGDKDKLGKLKVPSFEDQVDHWRERWFLPRCERMGVTTIEFDPERYRVSNFFGSGNG